MHDGLVVVWSTVIVEAMWIYAVELSEENWVDVLPQNLHVFVAVRSAVHVDKS